MKVPHEILAKVGATVLFQVGPNKVLQLSDGQTFPEGKLVDISVFWTELERFNNEIEIV